MPTTGNPPGARRGDVTRGEPTGAPVRTRLADRRAYPEAAASDPPDPARPRPRRGGRPLREMLKFGVVGAVAFVVDIGVFNLLRFGYAGARRHGQPLRPRSSPAPLATLSPGWATGYWTFRHRRQPAGAPRADALLRVQRHRSGDRPRLPGRLALRARTCAARWPTTSAPTVIGHRLGTLFRFWAYRTVRLRRRAESAPDGDPGRPRADLGGSGSRARASDRNSAKIAGWAWISSSRPPLDSARSRARASPSPVPRRC